MSNVGTTHLAGVTLASLLTAGGLQAAQAAPADNYDQLSQQHTMQPHAVHHYGSMHGHYAAMHGHYGSMHGHYAAMHRHYGPMHGHYAMHGHYGGMHGHYAMRGHYGVAGGGPGPGIAPQGSDFVGSYNPPQPNYGGSGMGFGLFGGGQPVYVLPNGDLTSSLNDYYNYRGPAYGYGPTGQNMGATSAENTPPPPAAARRAPGPGNAASRPPATGY